MRIIGRDVSLLVLALGLVFTMVPAFLTWMLWTFGDPPPYSIVWPRQQMQVLTSEVRPFRVGNGTIAAHLDVAVVRPGDTASEGVPLLGVHYSSVTVPEATRLQETVYRPGDTVRAMRAPDGDFYVVRWRFPDFLALFVIPLALIMIPVGLFALRLAVTRSGSR